MEQVLEKLDMAMKVLTLDLVKYKEDSPMYQKALVTLAKVYQAFNSAYDLAATDNINVQYYIKYADIEGIKTLLTNAGYLEESKKLEDVNNYNYSDLLFINFAIRSFE